MKVEISVGFVVHIFVLLMLFNLDLYYGPYINDLKLRTSLLEDVDGQKLRFQINHMFHFCNTGFAVLVHLNCVSYSSESGM